MNVATKQLQENSSPTEAACACKETLNIGKE